jgi:hypothetical protein
MAISHTLIDETLTGFPASTYPPISRRALVATHFGSATHHTSACVSSTITRRLPVVFTNGFRGRVILDDAFPQELKRFLRIFAILAELQHRRPAIRDDQRLAGFLDLAEKCKRVRLEARFRHGEVFRGHVTMVR